MFKNHFLIHRTKQKWQILNLNVNTARHPFLGRSTYSRMIISTVSPAMIGSFLTIVSSAKSQLNQILRQVSLQLTWSLLMNGGSLLQNGPFLCMLTFYPHFRPHYHIKSQCVVLQNACFNPTLFLRQRFSFSICMCGSFQDE